MNSVLDRTTPTERVSDRDYSQIQKIVVATDLSPQSENTAAYAAGFAKRFRASLILVHVFPPEPIGEFTSPQAHESFKEERHETEKRLRTFVEKVRETYPDCCMDFRIGDPAEEVTLVAEDYKADLIVTASHHPGFLGRLFGLAQAERILRRARCPVLIYNEKTQENT